MRSSQFNQIADPMSLEREAGKLAVRAARMSPDENGQSAVDPQVIDDLILVANKLKIIDPFGCAAQGVAFLNHRDSILEGKRPLGHKEACEALNFIVNHTAACRAGL